MCPSDETLPFCLPRIFCQTIYLLHRYVLLRGHNTFPRIAQGHAFKSQVRERWFGRHRTTYYYRSRLTSVCATMEYLIILYYSSTALEPVHKRCHFMAFKPVPDISTTLIIFKLKEHFVHHWLQHKQAKPHPEWIYCSLDFPEPPRTYVVNFAPPAPD